MPGRRPPVPREVPGQVWVPSATVNSTLHVSQRDSRRPPRPVVDRRRRLDRLAAGEQPRRLVPPLLLAEQPAPAERTARSGRSRRPRPTAAARPARRSAHRAEHPLVDRRVDHHHRGDPAGAARIARQRRAPSLRRSTRRRSTTRAGSTHPVATIASIISSSAPTSSTKTVANTLAPDAQPNPSVGVGVPSGYATAIDAAFAGRGELGEASRCPSACPCSRGGSARAVTRPHARRRAAAPAARDGVTRKSDAGAHAGSSAIGGRRRRRRRQRGRQRPGRRVAWVGGVVEDGKSPHRAVRVGRVGRVGRRRVGRPRRSGRGRPCLVGRRRGVGGSARLVSGARVDASRRRVRRRRRRTPRSRRASTAAATTSAELRRLRTRRSRCGSSRRGSDRRGRPPG